MSARTSDSYIGFVMIGCVSLCALAFGYLVWNCAQNGQWFLALIAAAITLALSAFPLYILRLAVSDIRAWLKACRHRSAR